MKVEDKISTSSYHSIEWGSATWSEDERSIRNRYNTDSGKFNQAGSSEVPWEDFKTMIKESISRGHLSSSEIADILSEISNKIR